MIKEVKYIIVIRTYLNVKDRRMSYRVFENDVGIAGGIVLNNDIDALKTIFKQIIDIVIDRYKKVGDRYGKEEKV